MRSWDTKKSQRTSETAVESKLRNYRNGYSKKTVKTQLGAVEVKVPRNRNGEYEPQIIGRYSRSADGMGEKILRLYACGMSQRDISEQIKSLYDVDISPELLSKISEKIMPEITAWQNRSLEAVYPNSQVPKLGHGFGPAPAHVPGSPDRLNPA